jgi:hypothetical protein
MKSKNVMGNHHSGILVIASGDISSEQTQKAEASLQTRSQQEEISALQFRRPERLTMVGRK